MNTDRFSHYAVLIIIACAALVSWFATAWGAGFTPDSVVYLRAVRSLADGQSLFQLGTHFPPGYSLLWLTVSALTGDDLLAPRLISVGSQLLMLAAVAVMLAQSLHNSLVRPLLVALLVMLVDYSSLFWMAWSEGPFLAALCWGIYFSLKIAEGDRQAFDLCMFCLSLAAMLLLRYAALPLVGGLLLFVLVSAGWPSRARLLSVTAMGLVAVAPLFLWLLISVLGAEQDAARLLSFHPPTEEHWRQLLATLASWSAGLPSQLMLVLLLALWLGAPLSRHWRQNPLAQCALLLIVSYVVFLTLSITFFDAHTPLDARILAPLLPLSLMVLCGVVAGQYQQVLAATLLVWVALAAPAMSKVWTAALHNGMGYNSRGVAGLDVLAVADELPAEAPIYTNIGELFYLHRNRETQQLPLIYHPSTRQANQSVAAQWEAALAAMREYGGVVVWNPLSRYRTYLPTVEDMLAFGDLVVSEERGGGVILRPREQPPLGLPAGLAIELE